MYNKRTWLNDITLPETGSVVAFDGKSNWKGKKIRNTFLSVSDCFVSARLIKTEDESMKDFIDKMELLRDEVDGFIKYLKKL